jgi:hypothetical protein
MNTVKKALFLTAALAATIIASQARADGATAGNSTDPMLKLGTLQVVSIDPDFEVPADDILRARVAVDLRNKRIHLTYSLKPNARDDRSYIEVDVALERVVRLRSGEVQYYGANRLGENAPVPVFEGNVDQIIVRDLRNTIVPMYCSINDCPAQERLHVEHRVIQIRGMGVAKRPLVNLLKGPRLEDSRIYRLSEQN